MLSIWTPGPSAVLDVVVYLVDDTPVPLAVESLPSVSAHELHRGLRDALQLPDVAADAFALWLISPLLGEGPAGAAGETEAQGAPKGAGAKTGLTQALYGLGTWVLSRSGRGEPRRLRSLR